MSPTEQPSTLRVLLVEDYPDLAEVMAEFLRAEGLDVTTAQSGREALEAAAASRPQLLLCDLNLPDMSGLDVVRGLRSHPATEEVYAVILTAMRETEPAQRSDAEALGVNALCSSRSRSRRSERSWKRSRRALSRARLRR